MTDPIYRQPRGIPSGGQFAAQARSDSEVTLLDAPTQPGEYVDEERHHWLDRSYTVRVNAATGLTDDEFNGVVDDFVIAALWSTPDDSDIDFDENPSGMLDGRFSRDDLAPSARDAIREVANQFLSENRDDVREALGRKDYRADDGTGPLGMLGHDMFLTSAGHGVGFWDRDALRAGGLGTRLTEASKKVEEIRLYPGDDGKLYAE